MCGGKVVRNTKASLRPYAVYKGAMISSVHDDKKSAEKRADAIGGTVMERKK